MTKITPIKYLINQQVLDGATLKLLPLLPQTIGSQILPETEYRLLGQNSFVLGGTWSDPKTAIQNGTAQTNNFNDLGSGSTTVLKGNNANPITLTLPNATGTIALTSDLPTLSTSSNLLFNSYNAGAITFEPFSASTADSTWVADNANAGKLYLGNVNPSKATRLNYNGNLYATKLYSNGFEVYTSDTFDIPTLQSVTEAGGTTTQNITLEGSILTVENGSEESILNINGSNNTVVIGQNSSSSTYVSRNITILGLDADNSNTSGAFTNRVALVAYNTGTGEANIDIDAKTKLTAASPLIDINGSTSVDIDGGAITVDATTDSNFTVTKNADNEALLTIKSTNLNAGSGASARVLVEADDEVELSATNIDINGAVNVSGDFVVNSGIRFKVTADSGNTEIGGTLDVQGNVAILNGDLTLLNGDITTIATSINLLDTDATTINAFGEATTLNIGHDGTSSSTTTIAGGITAVNNTKIVNIGTGADAAGATIVNIGASGAGVDTTTVRIYGDLIVEGTTTTINTETLELADNIIELNSNFTGSSPSESAGIEINRGTGSTLYNDGQNNIINASLIWDEAEGRWEANGNPIALQSSSLNQFAATTSAELAGIISDETGSGSLVFANTPTLITPVLGVATATSINALTLTAATTGFTVAGGTTSKTLTVSGNTDLSVNSILLESGKSITAQYANLTVGASEDTGDITLRSNDANARTLELTGSPSLSGITTTGTGTLALNKNLTVNNTYNFTLEAAGGDRTLKITDSSKEIAGDASTLIFGGNFTTSGAHTTTLTTTGNTSVTLPTTGTLATLSDISDETITIAAGNGLVTGGTFTLNDTAQTITVALGTPGTLSSTSTNEATTDSHTHAISSGSLTNDSQGTITVGGTGKVLDADITIELASAYGDTVNPYGAKTANTILAGPATGSAATPGFRAMVNADLPNSGVEAGTYSAVTVNTKGIVTAGAHVIQVGYISATPGTNEPSELLVVGGLFFEELV
jgi:hypothetical protein